MEIKNESLIHYVLYNEESNNYVINRPYTINNTTYYDEQTIQVRNGEQKVISGTLIDAYIFKTLTDAKQYENEYYKIRKVKMIDLGE